MSNGGGIYKGGDNMNNVNIGLCAGRHDIPGVSEYIFTDAISNPTDFASMRQHVVDFFSAREEISQANLYVTGLTPALIEVLDVARERGIIVHLMHFDRDNGCYVKQSLSMFHDRCGFCHTLKASYDYACPHCGAT